MWHRVRYRRSGHNCQLLLNNRSVAMAMPAQWTQCEEGGAASASTSASRESMRRAEASLKKSSTEEEKKNRFQNLGTESNLWLVIEHWFMSQGSLWLITDQHSLNLQLKNGFQCTNKLIKYTIGNKPNWTEAFHYCRFISWLISSFFFYSRAPSTPKISWHWASKTINVLGHPVAHSSELADLHLQPIVQSRLCTSGWKTTTPYTQEHSHCDGLQSSSIFPIIKKEDASSKNPTFTHCLGGRGDTNFLFVVIWPKLETKEQRK